MHDVVASILACRSARARIRGTDLWGKSSRDRQIVCLIEGNIEVGAEGEKPVTMNQRRQLYQPDKGKTQPVGFVDAKQLAEWSTETEIEPGNGAARLRGRHGIVEPEISSEVP